MRYPTTQHTLIADMVKVLKYLANSLNKQNYRTISRMTGVPIVQIRRFIEPLCMEHRKISHRHLRTYAHNLKYKKRKGERDDKGCMFIGAMRKQVLHMKEGRVDINMSKWDLFLSVADEYGYVIRRATSEEGEESGKKIFVQKRIPENQTVYFSALTVNCDTVEVYEWRYCNVHGWINEYEFIREKCPERDLCPHCNRKLLINTSSEAIVEYFEI